MGLKILGRVGTQIFFGGGGGGGLGINIILCILKGKFAFQNPKNYISSRKREKSSRFY